MFVFILTSRLWMICDGRGLQVVNTMRSGIVIESLSVYVIMYLMHSFEFGVFVPVQIFVLGTQLAGSILVMLWPV